MAFDKLQARFVVDSDTQITATTPDANRDFTSSSMLPVIITTPVSKIEFPKLLDPVDNLPPTTVIRHVQRLTVGKALARGVTADNGMIKRIHVNGQEAKALQANFAEWEITLNNVPARSLKLTAHAEDAAGNVERHAHVLIR